MSKMVKVRAGKLQPPDPRPWTADPESRKARKDMEKENSGFDWGQALALGMIGATVVFGIDRSLKKCEERHEEEDKREERRRQRESRSRPRRSSQSIAGSARTSTRDRHDRASRSVAPPTSRGGSRYDRDERSYYDDDEEYRDRYYEEREAARAARDYSREPARSPESMKGLDPKSGRDYERDLDHVERGYGYGRGYGRRYDDHTRSQSNPAFRSRAYSNW